MNRGFFSFESVLCFLLLVFLLFFASGFFLHNNSGLVNLVKIQKIRDLLVVWSYSGCGVGVDELKSDADFFLGVGNYSLWFGGREVVSGGVGEVFDFVELNCGFYSVEIGLSL